MNAKWLPLTLLGLLFFCSFASGDSLQLRSGRRLQGKFIGGTTTMVGFMTSGTIEYFATSDVLALMFDNNNESQLNGLQPNSLKAPASVHNRPALDRTRGKQSAGSSPKISLVSSSLAN
jgi:hypothetical protein